MVAISVETAAVFNNAAGPRSADATMAATTAQLTRRADPKAVANFLDQIWGSALYAGSLRACLCIAAAHWLKPIRKNVVAIWGSRQQHLVKIRGQGGVDKYTALRLIQVNFANGFIQSHSQIFGQYRWRLFRFDQSRPRFHHP